MNQALRRPLAEAAPRIAIVSAACEFPDASTPAQLWHSALHLRRAFRRIPPERLRTADYGSQGGDDCDGIYPIEAALIDGYEFDRAAFCIPRITFEATDLTHWLALDVASRALRPLAGWSDDAALRDATAVVVANTLTGEFSRAQLMRTRWPFVARTVGAAMQGLALDPLAGRQWLQTLEQRYKAAFPEPCEDTLAGSLSNTIAGRISNFHGLRGGAYSVDGACASSLLAMINACQMLQAGDVACVLVGGVDLSIDPFELVGFARNGALSRSQMRVFDAASDGFWPGEGCGFVVLASATEALRRGWPVLGWVRGWGLSTDGQGGLTRPTVDGQRLALARAYRRAGLAPGTVDYFEAHGTGTPTGDPVELMALAALLADGAQGPAIPVGSIKANIGHTKAAAGMAGLIKALGLAGARMLPGSTALHTPHPVFAKPMLKGRLRLPCQAEAIGHGLAVTVGVSGFGFGGVNAHLILQGPAPQAAPTTRHGVSATRQAAPPVADSHALTGELLLVSGDSIDALIAALAQLARGSAQLSGAELADLAAALANRPPGAWRACVVCHRPQAWQASLQALMASLAGAPAGAALPAAQGEGWAWQRAASTPPRIGYVFAGQAQHLRLHSQRWQRRFPAQRQALDAIAALAAQDTLDTAVAQPLLAEIALLGIDMLRAMGLSPAACLGHSFGELAALCAAGAYSPQAFRGLALARGQIIRDRSAAGGAMLSLGLAELAARQLAQQHDLDLACQNGLRSQVLAGDAGRIAAAAAAAAASGGEAWVLPTGMAFHSRFMRPAVGPVRAQLAGCAFAPLSVPVASTITGDWLLLPAGRPALAQAMTDLLARQLVQPVLFGQALGRLLAPAPGLDLVIEVGAGQTLTGMIGAARAAGTSASPTCSPACLALDLLGESTAALLMALGRCWLAGAALDSTLLLQHRGLRAFDPQRTPRFFANPCDAPLPGQVQVEPTWQAGAAPIGLPADTRWLPDGQAPGLGDAAAEPLLRRALRDLTGLPASAIGPDSRMLADLHLNSLRVRHLLTEVAHQLGIASLPFGLRELANAPLSELAAQLEAARGPARMPARATPGVPGIAPWVRCFALAWQAVAPAPSPTPAPAGGANAASPLLYVFTVATDFGAAGLPDLLKTAQNALANPASPGLLLLQSRPVLNGFARALARERPDKRVCVVTLPDATQASNARAAALFLRRAKGLGEYRLDSDGGISSPELLALPPTAAGRAAGTGAPARRRRRTAGDRRRPGHRRAGGPAPGAARRLPAGADRTPQR